VGFAGSGYAGSDFHRNCLTCPQFKRHKAIARRPAAVNGAELPSPVGAKRAGRESLLALDQAMS
jgi:hypothetical protein